MGTPPVRRSRRTTRSTTSLIEQIRLASSPQELPLDECLEPTELDVWRRFADPDSRVGVEPSDAAIVAVLRLALAGDFIARTEPDHWPFGDDDDWSRDVAHLFVAESLLEVGHELSLMRSNGATDLRLYLRSAARVFARSYGARIFRVPHGSVADGLWPEFAVAVLNEYPYSHSVIAHFLAPALRRVLLPPPSPELYFRSLEQLTRGKRVRPRLLPFPVTDQRELRVPPNYGWTALETWHLKAHLLDATFGNDESRLEDLVRVAVRLTKQFVSRVDVGASVFDFEQLCGPLRRYLFWHSSNAETGKAVRRRHQTWLRDLQTALTPPLPPRPRVVFGRHHKEAYANYLRAAQRAWQESRGDEESRYRRSLLEEYIDQFELLREIDRGDRLPGITTSDVTVLVKIREHFWRHCGDLYSIAPADFAHRALSFIQAINDRLPDDGGGFASGLATASRKYLKDLPHAEREPQVIKRELARVERGVTYDVQRVMCGPDFWADPVYPP